MSYAVKEIFYTLQGEGALTGRPAVFCRFAGCNLWSGREEDRAAAVCSFCDTDFVGTGGIGDAKPPLYQVTQHEGDADHQHARWRHQVRGDGNKARAVRRAEGADIADHPVRGRNGQTECDQEHDPLDPTALVVTHRVS